jgi:DNA-binding NarL/FixJ family response regulator
MIRLAIIDDDEKLAQTLKKELLEFTDIQSVLIYTSGLKFFKELQKLLPSDRPEIVIMDISMGFPNEGIQVTQQVCTMFPEIQVVMFTISDTDELVFEAFQAGAMGYLLKNEKPSFILKTILDVYHGGAQMSPSIARKTITFLTAPFRKRTITSEKSDAGVLTARELEILRLVEKGNTYEQIGNILFISTHTVKKHMMNIFSKLQVNNKIEAIKKTAVRY